MADQFVFELQFKGGNDSKENQFIIIDRGSMEDFLKLKEDLSKCTAEMFNVQYIDDEDDVIAVDSEEEFKEFAKLAKQRSSKGLLTKLVLESINGNVLKTNNSCVLNPTLRLTDLCMDRKLPIKLGIKRTEIKSKATSGKPSTSLAKSSSKNICSDPTEELKSKIVSELREVVHSEVARQMAANQSRLRFEEAAALFNEEEEEEDSDETAVFLVEERNNKMHRTKKKLEKRERTAESKIDVRLEKLEQKKRKLLEKASLRTANRKPAVDLGFGLPCIMSAIATKDSLTLSKRVTVGKAFLHVWHVVNDGTLAWNNVELRHTWSSPGLEPDELFVKCMQLFPGQDGQIAMKFKAPKSVGNFVSYWHFFYQVDSQWQQFGHFVSVSGNTKQLKHSVTSGATVKTSDLNKSSTSDKVRKLVTFSESQEVADANLLNEDPKTKIAKQQPKSKTAKQLASAEIAAEMAREAANATFRSAIAAANSINPSVMECLNGITELNLVDSGSDTDTNFDENNPGFVILDLPKEFDNEDKKELEGDNSESSQVKDTNPTTESNENERSLEDKMGNLMNILNGRERSYSENRKSPENDQTTSSKSGFFELKKNFSKSSLSFESVEDEVQDETGNTDENKPVEEFAQPMSFPRLDPNVNYAVFPPQRPSNTHQGLTYFPPPLIIGQNGTLPVNPNPQIAPQNPSPHLVFPPQLSHPSTNNGSLGQFPPRPFTTDIPKPTGLPPAFPGYKYPLPPTFFPHQIPNPCVTAPPPAHCQMTYPFYTLNTTPSPLTFLGQAGHQMNLPNAVNLQTPNYFGLVNDIRAAKSASHGLETNIAVSHGTAPPATAPTSTTKTSATNSESVVNPEVMVALKPQLEKPAEVKEAVPEEKDKEDKNEKSEPIVNILPQGLVDGAICAAASAYSTACNALNNLRNVEDKQIDFDPVFENNMALLVEMGFNNLERNARLLKRFNNDVSQVIGIICATGGAHGLDID